MFYCADSPRVEGSVSMLTILNISLLLVNLYSVGVSEKKLQEIEEKMDDMACIEDRINHLLVNLDSAFLDVLR